jgi:hypothetical protein
LYNEDISYGDIHESDDNLWNFLFFTGYLKKVSERTEEEDVYVTMTIPNLEIRSIYRNHIRGWFDQAVKKSDKAVFYKAVLDGDTEGMEDFRTIHSMMPPGWARTEAVAGSAAEAAIVEPRRAKLSIPARRRRT